jgi:probable regulatory domain-containing protein
VSEEVPLKPMGKEDIRRLELALILETLFREDVLEKIRSSSERITWLDSLFVAAAAFARDRAGYSVSKIAEELGRSESTIRNHLSEKTEAGKLVAETYQKIRERGGVLDISLVRSGEDKKRIEELEKEVRELREKLNKIKALIQDLLKEL